MFQFLRSTPIGPATLEQECIITQKASYNSAGNIKIKIGQSFVTLNQLVIALFTAEWQEVLKLVTGSKLIRKSCGNERCINPKHFITSLKRSHNHHEETSAVLKIDPDMPIKDLLELMKLQFPGEEVYLQIVSVSNLVQES